MFNVKGSLLVNAGAASPQFHRNGGVTHVAPQITSLGEDNASTFQNVQNFASWKSAFSGFTVGGWGTHGPNYALEAEHVAQRVSSLGLKFYIADTERHWLNGTPNATGMLLSALRARLGSAFPISVISFGYSDESQGQIWNNGYEVATQYKCSFLPELYDFGGFTYGMDKAIPYIEREGLKKPHLIALGDKTVPQDVAWLKSNTTVRGVWIWAGEQAGQDIESLSQLTLTPASPPPPDPIIDLMEKLKTNNTGINAALDRVRISFEKAGIPQPDGIAALKDHLWAMTNKINEVVDHLNKR